MVSSEEILITMLARDSASEVFDQVSRNAQSSLNGISGTVSGSIGSVGSSATSTFDQVEQGLQSVNEGMLGLSSVTGMVFRELGATKSATEYVYGTSSAEDTNKVLLQRMQDTEEQGASMYKTIDDATDNALVSMQDLIPSLNVIQSATGATGQELEDVTNQVAQFGSFVMAQTGSVELTRTAMDALAKAIKGSYQIVDDYGITEDALINTGLWDGAEDDLQGFMDAVTEVVGPMDALMGTSEGLDAQMGKMWSRAGKQIGRELLPYTKSLKTEFLELDRSMGGQLSKNLLLVQFGIETVQGKFYELSNFMDAIDDMNNGWNVMKDLLGGIRGNAQQSAEAISNMASASEGISQTAGGVAQMGADATQMSEGFIGGHGEAVGEVTGLGADYYQDLQAQNPGKKMLPNRAEYDAMMESNYSQFDLLEGMFTDGITAEEFSMVRGQPQAPPQGAYDVATGGGGGERGNPYYDLFNVPTTDQSGGGFNYHGDEYEEGVKLFGKKTEDMGSYGAVMNTYNNEIDDLTAKIQEAHKKENLIPKKGERGLEWVVDSEKYDVEGLRNSLTKRISEKESVKEMLKQAKESGDDRGFVDIVQDFTGRSLLGNTDISNVDRDDESAKTLSQAIRGKFGNFRTSIGSALDSVKNIPSALGGKISSVKESISSFASKLGQIKAEGISGAISRLDHALYNPFRNTAPVTEAVKGAETMAEGVSGVAEATAVVGAESATMGASAPAIEAGAVGAETTAVAETTLSGAFMSMLIPTIAIAGVIAILIPVVAGLVIEALFFINLIGQFITAMNFDSINVEGVAEKLQELAMVFAWIGVAMASMTFAGIMSAIGTLSASLLSLMGGFPQVVQLLTQVANEIRPLGQVTIDESVAFNLQHLGNALNGISMAMLSLNGVTLSTFVGNILTMGGLFGDLSTNLSGAKDDLQKAIDTINSLDFSGIDETKVQTISTTMQAIGNFGEAFSGLLKIRDDAKWSEVTNALLDGIFGTSTESIQQAFQNAHDDLKMASEQLQYYNDLEKVDEGTAQKIKNVSDSIVAIADALESLGKLKEDKGFWGAVDSFLNGSNDNLIAGLDKANVVIRQMASRVASLRTIANIPPTVTEKLKNLNESTKLVMDSIDAMGKIKSANDTTKLDTIPGIIQKAHHSIRQVSASIAGLRTISNIDPSVSDKLTKLTNALASINDALTQIGTVNTATGGWDFKGLDTKYTGITHTISSFAFQINGLGKNLSDESHSIPEDLSSKLARISESASALNTALVPIRNMPKLENTVGTNITNSVQMVKDTAGELNGLKGTEAVDKSISNIINRTGASANILKRVANQLKNFPMVNPIIMGLRIANAIKVVKSTAKQLKNITKDDKVGDISSTLKSVQTGISELKKTINAMDFKPEGANIGKSLKGGISSGLGGLAGMVHSKISGTSRSARSAGWTVGANAGEGAVGGTRSALKLSQIFKDEMDHIKTALDNHGQLEDSAGAMASAVVTAAKNALNQKSPGYIARMFGAEMGYSAMMIDTRGKEVVSSASNLAKKVVNGFNNSTRLTPKLMNFDSVKSDLNKAQIGTMMELRKPSTMGKTQRPVNISVSEGAVQLDARNMTMKESRQIMINALEGLDMVTGIDVDRNI